MGFFGLLCDVDIDECSLNLCKNFLMCVNRVNGFECICLSGLFGVYCENNIDECYLNLCLNGVMCEDVLDGFFCICK